MKKLNILSATLALFAVVTISSCSSISDQEYEINGVKFKMIAVEGGSFMMGATPGQGEDKVSQNEKPVHKVIVDDFLIGETEVTQELWFAVMGNNPSARTNDNGNLPVENISWNDVQSFINKINDITGQHFRLPYETEWEFAARGGLKSTNKKYAGSDDLDEVAWYEKNSEGHPHPVGEKHSNELGIYDMSGNVYEFCADNIAKYCNIRGGFYLNTECPIILSTGISIESKLSNVGFRLFQSVQ